MDKFKDLINSNEYILPALVSVGSYILTDSLLIGAGAGAGTYFVKRQQQQQNNISSVESFVGEAYLDQQDRATESAERAKYAEISGMGTTFADWDKGRHKLINDARSKHIDLSKDIGWVMLGAV